MKDPKDWTIDDLHRLIKHGVQESLTLDYKRSAALSKDNGSRNELVKDVSAFANSAGGLIVYGIIEEGGLPRDLDVGVDPGIDREWIEQVISSRIQPRLQGVLVKAIPLKNERSAYIINIPQAGTLAPHQAGDKKYYKRFNFSSVPMEDYEIRDALRRGATAHPILRFTSSKSFVSDGLAFNLLAKITNLGDEPALYVGIVLNIDTRLLSANENPVGWEVTRPLPASDGSTGKPSGLWVAALSRNIMPTNHMPIFREQTWNVLNIILNPAPLGRYLFGVRLFCPGFSFDAMGWVTLTDEGLVGDDELKELFAFL